ncbi:MAG: MFS transporter, partial [Anaerolineae bacterium]
MESNIPKFYAYRLTKSALFHISVLVIFYQSRGLSFAQVMLLQTIYYVVKVLSEVPTGAVADRFGRKLSLCLASLGHSLAYLTIFLSHSFPFFALGEGLAGLAMSLASGADSALAYDTLKGLGQEERYPGVEGKAYSMTLLAWTLFAPLGGLLATLDLALPYLASSAIMLISGLIALAFVEPPLEGNPTRSGYAAEVTQSLTLLRDNRPVLWLTLYSSFLYLALRLGFWTYQPYLETAGLALGLFGVAFAAFNLFSALMSANAGRVEAALGERGVLLVMPALLVISLLVMGQAIVIWAIPLIFLQQATRGLYQPIVKSYTNQHIPSQIRATVLSIQSMGGNLAFALAAPFLGSLVDLLSLGKALTLFALLVLTLSTILL